jgi:hypothetical protein
MYPAFAWYQVEFGGDAVPTGGATDIAGEHRVLTGAWNPAPKSKLIPAFE